MPHQHHKELEEALTQKGWCVTVEHPGDDYGISGSWEIQRSTNQPSLFIDFDGFDAMGENLPMEQSYGCGVRGHSDISLYFYRPNRSRVKWRSELKNFVDALDNIRNG